MDAERTDAGQDRAAARNYRRVLRMLPRDYRRRRGEEMLAVLLDLARDEGRERPTLAECWSIFGLSVRTRAHRPLAVVRRLGLAARRSRS